MFYDSAPAELAPNESFETTKHFIVGSGDVGSTNAGPPMARRVYTQYDVRENGSFGGTLAPGS